ncbi:hypothetical protein B0T14DRAFT_508779 [Immersiella caudata]|uniref:Uncharacterized protein n=1 Tax=Immersiella caudata TaxID=314043 RepID=A0AA40C5Y9_9PEZI|nr:hypothetical protein B0T14DRAFT_508779 [Immersiella caudata]
MDRTKHDAWETSQMQLNMMFDTWEVNSWMLRVEAAWHRLFRLEREYRKSRVSWISCRSFPKT